MTASILTFGEFRHSRPDDTDTNEMNNVQTHASGPAVLVAHGSQQDRTWVADLLSSSGYTVIMADNGRDALRHIAQERLTLAVVAVSMPVIDGLEVLRVVNEEYPGLPVIAVGSDDEIERIYLRSAEAQGAVFTFTLPVPGNVFLDGVRRAYRGLRRIGIG